MEIREELFYAGDLRMEQEEVNKIIPETDIPGTYAHTRTYGCASLFTLICC